ncbi:glycoside hydrolase family 79 protein [Mycena vitilis]|nr:glycoside hydrolase family 79 protein [Mycena vitilis]
MLVFAVSILSVLHAAVAAVTVYGQIPLGATTAPAPGATVAAAYNDTTLTPPPIPNPAPATAFTLNIPTSSTGVTGLSIPIHGTFFGFSIEMSVITQLMGKNSTFLQVPLLNLFSNLVERGGGLHVRVGGNTQEYAYYVPEIPDGHAVAKEQSSSNNPVNTNARRHIYDGFILPDVQHLLACRRQVVYRQVFHPRIPPHAEIVIKGVPFNDTSNFRLEIVEYSEAILGDNLLGVQVGNEPDLYPAHGHRPESYGPQDYVNDFGQLVGALAANPNITVKNNLIGPSLSGTWTPEMLWDTGFISQFTDSLGYLSVEHYPSNNCFARFGLGTFRDPQTVFDSFLTHAAGVRTIKDYLASTALAQASGKPFLMFETNSASCGGFPGVSDSFGGALWALDYGLQMAYSNFSGALFHVGGQNVFYNPFTAPPTNVSKYNEWTVGALYYSAIISAEVFGKTNTSQILDLLGNDANDLTPQYAIYENGALARVALFNYMDDPSGANDYKATISVGGGAVPASVQVKYFLSESVSTKNNITWANQTLGTKFTVDGRFKGDLNIVSIPCDTNANTCVVPVPAPGFALVSLLAESDISPVTFSTTAHTNTAGTATVAPEVLSTSNGMSGKNWQLGSTSKSHKSGAHSLRCAQYEVVEVWLAATIVLLGLVAEGFVV